MKPGKNDEALHKELIKLTGSTVGIWANNDSSDLVVFLVGTFKYNKLERSFTVKTFGDESTWKGLYQHILELVHMKDLEIVGPFLTDNISKAKTIIHLGTTIHP